MATLGRLGIGGGGTADMGWIDNDFTPGAPAAAEWHHLVYTYDGTTTRVYSDGALANSEILGAGAINTHADSFIALASQIESDGTTLSAALKGSLAISRMRIHDGVLSDAQIAANYAEESGSFFNPAPPTPPVAKPLAENPIHRYSFNNAAAADAGGAVLIDSIGGANGVVKGEGASFSGSRLKLPGGSSETQAYGDLPNGLISGLTEFTIEGWVGIDGSQTWQRVFDFGSNESGELDGPGGTGAGLDYIFLSANRGDNVSQQRVEWRNEDPAGGGILTMDANQETTPPQDIHFAVVFDPDGGIFGEATLKYYRDGELQAESTTNLTPSEINDVNNWLGRSNWTNDSNFEGTYDEFRIYDQALTPDEILGNIEAGPDVVNVVPEPKSLLFIVVSLVGIAASRCRRKKQVSKAVA